MSLRKAFVMDLGDEDVRAEVAADGTIEIRNDDSDLLISAAIDEMAVFASALAALVAGADDPTPDTGDE